MRARRLLVKTKPMPAGTSFGIGKVPFKLRPLLPDLPRKTVMGAAAPAEWHITEHSEDVDESDLWDLCHQLRTSGFGVAGGPAVEFAEPDLEQQWPVDSPDRVAGHAFAATRGEQCQAPPPPDSGFPFPKNFDWRWYQDDEHSGLAKARSEVGDPKDRVTIAHLDTGYR